VRDKSEICRKIILMSGNCSKMRPRAVSPRVSVRSNLLGGDTGGEQCGEREEGIERISGISGPFPNAGIFEF
jgi:hypothetical protein